MDDEIGNVDGLILGVGGSGDDGKIDDFFNYGKDGRGWFTQIISFLLDHVLAL